MNEPHIENLKQQICEIGRRVYQKGFAAANEGNISVRAGENQVLCTPTLTCKGFMSTDDICTVDMEGRQVDGKKKATSEVLLHLNIYRERPDVKSVVHCHPPHATAFGVAREPVPMGVLPEPDIFLGEVPIAAYETPGNQNFADTILKFVMSTDTIILANHGTVTYSNSVEEAYWLTEILDAYCRILILSKQIGRLQYLPLKKGQEILELRRQWGFKDARNTDLFADRQQDVCNHVQFRETWQESGVRKNGFPEFDTSDQFPDQDALIERIADRVAEKLAQPRDSS